MIVTVIGKLGTGKTLLMTYLAQNYDSNKIVYSNYNIDIPNNKVIDVEDLTDVADGLVLIDEAYLWLESRLSTSRANRFVTKIMFQSRKRGFDVGLSAQVHSSIDLRVRQLEQSLVVSYGENAGDFETYCENERYRELVNELNLNFFFDYVVETQTGIIPLRLSFETAYEVSQIYDTTEFPHEMEVSKFEPDKYDEKVEGAVEVVKGEVEDEDNLKRLAQRDIKDLLYKNGITDRQILEGVISRIKMKYKI